MVQPVEGVPIMETLFLFVMFGAFWYLMHLLVEG